MTSHSNGPGPGAGRPSMAPRIVRAPSVAGWRRRSPVKGTRLPEPAPAASPHPEKTQGPPGDPGTSAPSGGTAPASVAQEIQSRRRTVLIVDDEPLNLRVFAEALKDDYEVRVAKTGVGALRAVGQSHPPDLVLLDVTMPDMSGHQVLRILKSQERTRDVPIIFVTGRDQVNDEAQGLEEGAVDYITKPVALTVLRARVRTHIELKRRSELLAALTATDALTGIANRRHLDEALNREWRRCMRRGAPLGLAMLDVDHFKRFNDRYGHSAGDDCLRQVAHALARGVLRSGDVAARFGGEEFALVLPETDGPGSVTVAERVRQAVVDLAIPHEMSDTAVMVTVSAGVAAVIPRAGVDPVKGLLEVADIALYSAKRAGRNRVALAESPPPPPVSAPTGGH